jgi:hypothetical protein
VGTGQGLGSRCPCAFRGHLLWVSPPPLSYLGHDSVIKIKKEGCWGPIMLPHKYAAVTIGLKKVAASFVQQAASDYHLS